MKYLNNLEGELSILYLGSKFLFEVTEIVYLSFLSDVCI